MVVSSNELEDGQSMSLRSVENVIIDPCDTAISLEYSTGTLTNYVSSSSGAAFQNQEDVYGFSHRVSASTHVTNEESTNASL